MCVRKIGGVGVLFGNSMKWKWYNKKAWTTLNFYFYYYIKKLFLLSYKIFWNESCGESQKANYLLLLKKEDKKFQMNKLLNRECFLIFNIIIEMLQIIFFKNEFSSWKFIYSCKNITV